MSTLDTLLSIDNSKLNVTNEKINIVRLSEMAGEDVIFEIRPLSIKEINSFPKMDETDMLIHAIYMALVSPKLSDERLLKKYDCLTPKELIKKILLPTEISGLYSAFNRAMGFVQNTEDDEKSSEEGVN